MKHTPGPWELDNSDGTIRSKQFASSDQMGDFRGVVVCDMAAGLGTSWGHPARAHALPETLANAQMITAAPDLLEALTQITALAREWNANYLGGMAIQRKRWEKLAAIAEAAIRKAKGESL